MRATPLMLAVGLALGVASPVEARPPREAAPARADALRTWIVVFDEPAAAAFRGFPAGSPRPKLAPTSPAATGARRYDAKAAPARAYAAYLADLRATRLDDIATRIGRPVSPRHVYVHATNGVALALSAKEAAAVAGVPGVRGVSPEFRRTVQSNASMPWINADDVWTGAVPGVGAHHGEGTVVGMIDSGLYRTHTAFAGAGIVNPRGQVFGWCTQTPSACNGKVIGLWNFAAAGDGLADPVDGTGHGTHTTGVAVGNPFLAYSGVAPKASVISYKACATSSCNGAALIASIDQAVADGVDVINYSIGFLPTPDPWAPLGSPAYDDTEAFLAAREAGIVVVAAAGNSGPGPGTLTKPGNAPWIVSVANSSDSGSGAPSPDLLMPSSGRGPVVPFGVLKPDVSAPGWNIMAPVISGPTAVGAGSGTSMASPHVAGAAALLLSTDPALTPDQIVSALLLTARNSVQSAVGVPGTPHDQGAGMIDVAAAARAGLYLPIPPAGFRDAAAEPYAGGAERLNLPSIAHGACFRSCTITRELALMPDAVPGDYAVAATTSSPGASIVASPATFAGTAAGGTLTVTVDTSDPAVLDTWVYGWVTLTDVSGAGRPTLRLPVAVYATPYADASTEAALADVKHAGTGERGHFDVPVGGTVALPDARFSTTALAAPTTLQQDLPVDQTPYNAFDSIDVYRGLLPIPATASATTYRIDVSTRHAAGDVDLFVGIDTNGNGFPEVAEVLCQSTSPDSDEDCAVTGTHTAATAYWVIAQNFGPAPLSGVTIETVVLPMTPAPATVLRATGPGHVPAATPFAIRVGYDDPTLLPGQRRLGALIVEATPGEPVLSVPFEIVRVDGPSTPYALTPGIPRAVSLPAGPAVKHLVVDLPPGTAQATFRTTGTAGDVSLHLARMDLPPGPVVASAPPAGAPLHTATGTGADRTIVLSGDDAAAGRWYVTVESTGAAIPSLDVSVTIDAVDDVPALRRGAYYNPARGGHGLFLYPSGDQHALLWYTYLQDGTPTWYYAQGPQPGADQVWRGIVHRAAWNGTSRILVPIGDLVLTPRADGKLSVAYNIDGFTGAETLDTFLTGCPPHAGQPLDVSAHWYDTVSPGYGYSVQVHPEYEFLATFVYDGLGVPRFLAAERGGAFDGDATAVPLAQLAGFAPLGPHTAPVRTPVGQLLRTYGPSTIQTIGANAAFVNGVPGTWARTASVTRLSDLPQGCAP